MLRATKDDSRELGIALIYFTGIKISGLQCLSRSSAGCTCACQCGTSIAALFIQPAAVCAETSRSVLQQLAAQPKAPVAAMYSGMHLTCGVNGTVAICDGATAVIRSILRRYKPRVPSDGWIRVCASMARLVHIVQCGGSAGAQSASSGDSQSHTNMRGSQQAASATESGGGRDGSRVLPGVLAAVAHAIGSVIYEELHACDAGMTAQKGEPRRREAAARLQNLSHYGGVSKLLVYEECPLLARQIELALTAAAAPTFEQVCAFFLSDSFFIRLLVSAIFLVVLLSCV